MIDRIVEDDEKTALFIDGANLYSATKALGFDLDYKKLLDEFQRKCRLLRAYYYTALMEEAEFSPIRPLIDWLDYNGFRVVTKPAREFADAQGRRRVKGDMDVEIVVDMLELAPRLDHAVLFSGDGDFVAAVECLQRRGVRVSVVSTLRTNPPMVSDDLRRRADQFIELSELSAAFSRTRQGAMTRGYDDPSDDADHA
jgi:uncharacterized LabA/DUF88 family protein